MTESTPIQPIPADTIANLRAVYLQMIQGVIGRTSGYSANVKNYCVTIVAGLLAFYSQKPDSIVILFAAFAVLMLGLLERSTCGSKRHSEASTKVVSDERNG